MEGVVEEEEGVGENGVIETTQGGVQADVAVGHEERFQEGGEHVVTTARSETAVRRTPLEERFLQTHHQRQQHGHKHAVRRVALVGECLQQFGSSASAARCCRTLASTRFHTQCTSSAFSTEASALASTLVVNSLPHTHRRSKPRSDPRLPPKQPVVIVFVLSSLIAS